MLTIKRCNVLNLSGDDEDDAEQSRYRDSLESADFTEKLYLFERLTSAAGPAAPHPASSLSWRPSSAPLSSTAAAQHGADRQRQRLGSDSVVTFHAVHGWTRRGHRVGVVETPTGDRDLDASVGRRLDDSPSDTSVERRADVLIQDVFSPSVRCGQAHGDAASPPSKKSSSSPKRHGGRDRLSDIKAAILASAAAKLSTTGSALSAQSNRKSPDCLQAVKCSSASSQLTGSSGLQAAGTVDYQSSSGIGDVDDGTDTSSEDSGRLLKEFSEQSSQSTHSSSSSRTEISPTNHKPPSGRIFVEPARSSKQADRRNFDKSSSFSQSAQAKPQQSPSPNSTHVFSFPVVGKAASRIDRALNDSLTWDQQSPTAGSSDSSTSVSSPSSPHCFSVVPCESATAKRYPDDSSAKSFEQTALKCGPASGTRLPDSHLSDSECSKSLKIENGTLTNSGDYQGEKLSSHNTVVTSIVIADAGKNTARIDSVSTSSHQGRVVEDLHSPKRRLRSTAELVVNAVADNEPDIKRSDRQLSVDASPNQSRKIRKVVTFAEERNRACIELSDKMNGDMEMESEKPTNNNSVMVSRPTPSENVQSSSDNKDDVAQSDIDVSNANVIWTNDETQTASVDRGSCASGVGRDLLQQSVSTVSVRQNDGQRSELNGHESNDLLASEADDAASISDWDSEDLSASQRDLRSLYQQRRAERLEEQKAAELEKQRLEEILKLCTEFGLSSDISSSLLVGEEVGGSAAEKAERRNSLGRIKTNGSLTKLAGLPSADPSSAVDRRLNQSGSNTNSDDDVDCGTVRRRPLTTKKLDVSAVTCVTSKNTLPVTAVSDRTVRDTDKALRTVLARTGSGTLPTVGLSVESAGRSKSVPMIDTNMTLVDGELERLLQSNIDFSLPTAADWRVGQSNHPGTHKSSLDWYTTSLPEYSAIWDSVNTWKSSQHRVSALCHMMVLMLSYQVTKEETKVILGSFCFHSLSDSFHLRVFGISLERERDIYISFLG